MATVSDDKTILVTSRLRRTGHSWLINIETKVSQWNCFPVCPKRLKVVIVTGLVIEQVNDHATVVQDDPATFVIALDSQSLVTEVLFKFIVDLLADRVQLATACTRSQDKKVKFG